MSGREKGLRMVVRDKQGGEHSLAAHDDDDDDHHHDDRHHGATAADADAADAAAHHGVVRKILKGGDGSDDDEDDEEDEEEVVEEEEGEEGEEDEGMGQTPRTVGIEAIPTGSELVVLKGHKVRQRRPHSCIAAGCEMLLRAGQVQGIDYETFQDDFDMGLQHNTFATVIARIKDRYPQAAGLMTRAFDTGNGKLAVVDGLAKDGVPVLLSLPRCVMDPELDGWHIFPLVGLDRSCLYMLHGVTTDGQDEVMRLKRKHLVVAHDSIDGGKDIAWLAKTNSSGARSVTHTAGSSGDSSEEDAGSHACLKCKKRAIEFRCQPCRCPAFCKPCAMKMASGGKCKRCGRFYESLRRI